MIKKSTLEKMIAEKYDNKLRDLEIKIRPHENISGFEIIISQMYNYVDFDFEFLSALSEMFKTRKINIGDKWSSEGCETCDYGSCYTVSLYVHNVGVEIDWDN